MRTLVIVLYVIAGIAPVLRIVMAWLAARRTVAGSREHLARLEEIPRKYDALRAELPEGRQWHGPESEALNTQRAAEDAEAGRIRFTYHQMDLAPHYVTDMILRHLARRFPLELSLIIGGLITGTVASILSLTL